jgi:hypothetical protein
VLVPLRDYLRVVLADRGLDILDLLGRATLRVSVYGRMVDGPESTVSLMAASRIVLDWGDGPMLDVLTRGVVRQICLN